MYPIVLRLLPLDGKIFGQPWRLRWLWAAHLNRFFGDRGGYAGYGQSIPNRFFGDRGGYGGYGKSIPNRFFNVFLTITVTHLLYRSSDLKHMTSFWCLILFFIDWFFICSLGSVICKKYANINGKNGKYTKAIGVSIIWSCDMGGSRRRRVTCIGRGR